MTDIREMANNGQFDTWESFIAEMRCIWGNARQYNEEESQIYEFAEDLEVRGDNHFNSVCPLTVFTDVVRGPHFKIRNSSEEA